jgi:tyrosine decarboxylase / aspartate 1-decarboxylase
MNWKRLTKEEQSKRVFQALKKNISYKKNKVMGVPGSYLDPRVFSHKAAHGDPFLSAMLENPNHIGCHTLGQESEPLFRGTHELECEVIRLCAENIMRGKPLDQDGYIAGGGTESIIEALWIYRNYFAQTYKVRNTEIGVLFSQDTSVSVIKGCDLLDIRPFILKVNDTTREIDLAHLRSQLISAKDRGIQYFIAVLNMGSELFGSVDDADKICQVLEEQNVVYKIHVDAGLGGFIYPFTQPGHRLNFENPKITSINIDAYKILRAPFGTSIFMIRKGYMNFSMTEEARYVSGKDHTLIGSRSGANSVAIWMLLKTLGSKGMNYKMQRIFIRTRQLCEALDEKHISYFHQPGMNIVAIKNKHMSRQIESHFGLVPDDVENPQWWRVVVMDHVDNALIDAFIEH